MYVCQRISQIYYNTTNVSVTQTDANVTQTDASVTTDVSVTQADVRSDVCTILRDLKQFSCICDKARLKKTVT